jgi:Protein of unknown function with PCYCGC motif
MMRRGLLLAFLFLVTLTMSAQWSFQEEGSGIPAYNANPPKPGTKLPPILGKEQLWGQNAQYPFQSHAYELAAKIPVVLRQQPCYCYCDRMGHNSLHSCFEDTHGAQCATCLKELYYSYSEHKKGRMAKQIRAGIIRGEWKQVDLQSAASMN